MPISMADSHGGITTITIPVAVGFGDVEYVRHDGPLSPGIPSHTINPIRGQGMSIFLYAKSV